MIRPLILALLVYIEALSVRRSVKLPVLQQQSHDLVKKAWDDMVSASQSLEASGTLCYRVPALEATVQLVVTMDNSYNLLVEADSDKSAGWLCTKMYQHRVNFAMLDLTDLRKTVAAHFDALPPHPGYVANVTWNGIIEDVIPESALEELRDCGYVVVEGAPPVSKESHEKLSAFLTETTGQEYWVRTDKVYFLTAEQAKASGVGEQHTMLCSIAKYLNEKFDLPRQPYNPIAPATLEQPLTLPESIQLAEYGQGDFYKAHKDNSLTDELTETGERKWSNFRA
jgi:hypothetical protein